VGESEFANEFSWTPTLYVIRRNCKQSNVLERNSAGMFNTPVGPQNDRREFKAEGDFEFHCIVLSRIFQGSTDATMFEDFIEQLLKHCGKWPEPKSVLVMDNASFHHSDRINEMCSREGVKLVYLPPHSPDLNPIEEFFAELKAFIRRNWQVYEENPDQGFDHFLEWCVEIVGARDQSAKGHFRHAGLVIEEYALENDVTSAHPTPPMKRRAQIADP
jgi:transposase